jgi:hypothetical protein
MQKDFDENSPTYRALMREDQIDREVNRRWANAQEGRGLFLASRFAIRTGWICLGAALGGGFLACAAISLGTFFEPLAELSIARIVGAVLLLGLAWLLAKWAIKAAFGAAPTEQERKTALRTKITATFRG